MHVQSETILRKLMVWWLLLVPVAGFAASGDEFYQRLYERGMAHFAASDYAAAFTELRNAAFGFVEQVEKFETVQAYAAIAAHRLQHDTDARDSLMRIVAAEKIQQHFRSVKLPGELRTEVDTIAATLLTTDEATLLGVPAEMQEAAARSKPPVVVPTPTKRSPVATTAPHDKGNDKEEKDTTPPDQKTPPKPVPPTPQPVQPSPQPAAPAPQPVATPQPVTPVTQPQPQPTTPPRPATSQPQPVTPVTQPQPQPTPPQPQPVVPPPQPRVAVPQPVTPAAQPVTPTPRPVTPNPRPVNKQPDPKQDPPQTQPVVPVPVPKPAAKGTEASLADAQRAVDDGEINRARSIYATLLSGPELPHAAALQLAEGLYRVRDFAAASRAFQRAGTFGHGEERYHYVFAISLYESGRYADAKREMKTALPYITATEDVGRYRAKIEGAIE